MHLECLPFVIAKYVVFGARPSPNDEVMRGVTPNDKVMRGVTPNDEVMRGERMTPNDEVMRGRNAERRSHEGSNTE